MLQITDNLLLLFIKGVFLKQHLGGKQLKKKGRLKLDNQSSKTIFEEVETRRGKRKLKEISQSLTSKSPLTLFPL